MPHCVGVQMELPTGISYSYRATGERRAGNTAADWDEWPRVGGSDRWCGDSNANFSIVGRVVLLQEGLP
jgi:hypothetical protein